MGPNPVEPGEILACFAMGIEQRELTLQPVRVPPTLNLAPGANSFQNSPWIVVGYEVCSRVQGTERWCTLERFGRSDTLADGLRRLAAQPDVPDEGILHPALREARRRLREEEAAEASDLAPAE